MMAPDRMDGGASVPHEPQESAIPTVPGEKAAMVEAMFDRIAGRYDTMNDLMTFGMHRLWKDATLRSLGGRRHAQVLDVATGTGDLALALATGSRTARVVGLDFSARMLAQAAIRGRAAPATATERLTWIRGDALALPFADSAFSAATSAFALRNVADLGQMFRELARVLGPGGRVALLDLVPIPDPPPWTRLAQFHLQQVVPRAGKLLAGDTAAYIYLPTSIGTIPPLPEIARMVADAGFTDVRQRLFGAGTVALITGTRR
jgi:demethylmenaquinone methyltransferase/2-methoxy-6-polyprenyl-1,4-benzoquinol methylase